MRAVGIIRVSKLADGAASPAAQRDRIEAHCEAQGWTLIDVFEELDVSRRHTTQQAPWPVGPRSSSSRPETLNIIVAQRLRPALPARLKVEAECRSIESSRPAVACSRSTSGRNQLRERHRMAVRHDAGCGQRISPPFHRRASAPKNDAVRAR